MTRPTVSLIAPFAGPGEELDRFLAAIGQIGLLEGDEIIVADNRARPEPGGVVIEASGPRSSYYARQVAAERARGEWLVFVDADTTPDPGLLDAYFDPPPAERTAVLAGGIDDVAEADTPVARYVTARRKLDQSNTLAHSRPYAQTANAAVRRSAFEEVGGFPDPVRSGADADLCWRLAAAGWGIESRPQARVRHRSRATLGALLAQLHRHGSGMQWLDRRYPGAFPPPRPRDLLGRFRMLARGDVMDFVALWAADAGRLRANGDPS